MFKKGTWSRQAVMEIAELCLLVREWRIEIRDVTTLALY